MRLIIEARLEDDQASSVAIQAATIVAVLERQDHSVSLWDSRLPKAAPCSLKSSRRWYRTKPQAGWLTT